MAGLLDSSFRTGSSGVRGRTIGIYALLVVANAATALCVCWSTNLRLKVPSSVLPAPTRLHV